MTSEEARSLAISLIIQNRSLSSMVVEENINMWYDIRPSRRESLCFLAFSRLSALTPHCAFRYCVVDFPVELFYYINQNGSMIISYKDLLDYKTLMDM